MSTCTALKVSRDRKVSPLSKWETGKARWVPMVANSFGLPAGLPELGGSCIGATEFCKGCYAAPMEGYFPAVGRLVRGNLEALQSTSKVADMVALLSGVVSTFIAECEKAERKGHVVERVYRIHWDGDFFSRQYALAWAQVMRLFPDVQFWLYTRSFAFVSAFADVPNVAVYLSVDYGNVAEAAECHEAFPFTRLAFCAATWDETEILADKFPGERRGPRCPELTGKVPMVGPDGRGACVSCGLCVYGRNNVRFAQEKGGK